MVTVLAIIEFAIVAISSIVAVMNPLSTTAIFLTLTKGEKSEENRKTAAKATKLGGVLLAFFALSGTIIFQLFNIELFSFQIAGGILLVTMALKMLSEKNGYSSVDREDISIIPLTFPLTAGPGTILTVILIFSQATTLFETIFVFVAIAIGVLLSYQGMIHAHQLLKYFGKEGVQVVSSLMAIIVLAMAIQFIIGGIFEAVSKFPL
jgi:multiple antibiotic resistance protein